MLVLKERVRLAMLSGLWVLAGCAPAAGKPERAASQPVRGQVTVDASTVGILPMAAAQPSEPSPLFSHEETISFLAAAKVAESIEDPLQRCLAYPDPPRSQWSHEVTVAYCRYRLQPMISQNEVTTLIQSGHSAELDARMSAALHAQETRKDSVGLLDEIYRRYFAAGSQSERVLLDKWRNDSPHSAFAYAASGYAYVQAALYARGGDFAANTPKEKFDAMQALLGKANEDIRRSLEISPKLTPAYFALIQAASVGGDRDAFTQAESAALRAAPTDYSIYVALMSSAEPKWSGSMEAMKQLAQNAQPYSDKNPLLVLLLTDAAFYEAYNCHCGADIQLASFSATFVHSSSTGNLWSAGDIAAANDAPNQTLVYLSEVLRLNPMAPLAYRARAQRALVLTDAGEPAWALSEANKVVAEVPNDDSGYKARATAYEALQDYPNAIVALKSALRVGGDDPTWKLIELGNIYTDHTHQWDEAWDVSNQAIQLQPDRPLAWIIRAEVQQSQPRPGLDDTLRYFIAHFGDDPTQQEVVSQMRQELAGEAKSKGH